MSEHEGERDRPDRRPGAGENEGYGQDPYAPPQYGSPQQGQPAYGDAPQGYGQPPQGQPAYGSPPYGQPPAYGTPPYGQPPAYGNAPYPGQAAMYAEPSQAVLALVLAIVGLVAFQLLCPVAWVLANREIQGIDQGRRNPTNRGTAVAAKVIGIIGTVLLALGLVIVVIAVVALVAASPSSS